MKFNERLKPNTEFIVYQPGTLSNDNYEILNALYLPVIGTEAFGIYLYLAESTKVHDKLAVRFHRELMDELALNLSDYQQSLDKLEAIGLVRTYVSNKEHDDLFVYRLLQPLTAEMYFKDPMLSMYLYSQVGSQKFNDKKDRLIYPELPEDITEVTKKFTEVFYHSRDESFRTPNDNFKQNDVSRGPSIDLDDFDFEVLFTHLKGTRIDRQFFTKEVKVLVVQLSQLFKLNAYDIKQILLQSTSPQFGIDKDRLKTEARKYYQKEYGEVVPSFTTAEEAVKPAGDESYLDSLDKVSPLDRINDLRSYKPSENDLKVVTELIVKTGLENGVINVLLEYAIQMKDGELPLRYAMTIAENWEKEGYRTAAEAYQSIMEFREAQEEKRRKRQFKYAGPGEEQPAWLKEKTAENSPQQKRTAQTKPKQKNKEPMKTLKDDEDFSELINKFREN
ncbi:Replication initiation and membrane attachment protein [Jeotgalicoccus saudimassiliensis]|uniref:Replication initiation and membrane attachment protein n=1 Tax=Jeotgalicoccus saudimassiliensis TaxID=1461582 RepID=A0A078M377_9STAP|nr:DnaD domain protein [Jeotgalicoccus saudimassiliensis]CEA00689.1 Replication initiation and membrane attachment protein [Jeotgalicoccus saudimassiliensis]